MVLNWLDRYRDAGLLLLRIGLGLSYMFVHGQRKLFGGSEVWEKYGQSAAYVGLDFLPVFWGFMAGFAEFIGGLLLLFGFLFRPAAFLILCAMIVATGMHLGTGEGAWSRPAEMAIVMLALILIGPGKYSLDYRFSARYRRTGLWW